MWLIKGAFVGKNNFDVIKMHGKTIKMYTFNLNFTFHISALF